MRVIALAIAVMMFAVSAWAEPNAELYQLQERCGKSAAEVFAKLYSNGYVKFEGKPFQLSSSLQRTPEQVLLLRNIGFLRKEQHDPRVSTI
jgi:predicted component of type VI protein secretion system